MRVCISAAWRSPSLCVLPLIICLLSRIDQRFYQFILQFPHYHDASLRSYSLSIRELTLLQSTWWVTPCNVNSRETNESGREGQETEKTIYSSDRMAQKYCIGEINVFIVLIATRTRRHKTSPHRIACPLPASSLPSRCESQVMHAWAQSPVRQLKLFQEHQSPDRLNDWTDTGKVKKTRHR